LDGVRLKKTSGGVMDKPQAKVDGKSYKSRGRYNMQVWQVEGFCKSAQARLSYDLA
jgi:hypothetical protein